MKDVLGFQDFIASVHFSADDDCCFGKRSSLRKSSCMTGAGPQENMGVCFLAVQAGSTATSQKAPEIGQASRPRARGNYDQYSEPASAAIRTSWKAI